MKLIDSRAPMSGSQGTSYLMAWVYDKPIDHDVDPYDIDIKELEFKELNVGSLHEALIAMLEMEGMEVVVDAFYYIAACAHNEIRVLRLIPRLKLKARPDPVIWHFETVKRFNFSHKPALV
jgi:hypothetical protein